MAELEAETEDSFAKQVNILQLAVSTVFDNEEIGKCVKQTFDEDEYEELDDVLDELNDIKESNIIHGASEKIKNDKNINYKWDANTDEQKLYQLLVKIFKYNITEIDKLIDKPSLPNTLYECNNNHILIIAETVCNDINKTVKKPINTDNVKKLIITEKFNGESIANIATKEFCNKAKAQSIPAAKGRKLLTAIKQYKFEHNKESVCKDENVDKQQLNGINVEKKDELSWKGVTQITDCNNKHIIYILDNYIFNDLKQEKLNNNKENIINCMKYHGLNGEEITKLNRKDFGSKLAEYCNNTKLKGVCVKLYKPIIEFDMKRISSIIIAIEDDNKSISEPDNNNNNNYITSIGQCNVDQIVCILRDHLSIFNQKKFSDHKDLFISYFTDKQIDGTKFVTMNRKQFGAEMVKYCNNKKLNGPAMQIFKALNDFEFDTVKLPMMKQLNNTYKLNELKECNCDELVYLLEKHIFDKVDNKPFKENAQLILSYFSKNNIDGQQMINMQRKEFITNISTHCDSNKKLNGGLAKLYKLFDTTDISQIAIPSTLKRAEVQSIGEKHEIPSAKPVVLTSKKQHTLEDCNTSQIIDALQNHIFNDPKLDKIVKKLAVNKDMVIEYIKANELNGKAIKVMTRKQFGQNISDYCSNKKLNGPLMKIFKAINEFNYNSIATDISQIAIPFTLKSEEFESMEEKHEMPPAKPVALTTSESKPAIQSISECNVDQIICILRDHLSILNEGKYSVHKDRFISYFTDQQVDGTKFETMNRKQFGAEMVKFGNNKKLNGPAMKIFKALNSFKFDTLKPPMINMSAVNTSSNTKSKVIQQSTKSTKSSQSSQSIQSTPSTYKVNELKECKSDELIYLLENHFFDKVNNKPFQQNTKLILSYFSKNNIDGQQMINMQRKELFTNISTHCNSKKLNGGLAKLYKLFDTTDISQIDIPSTLKSEEFESMEEKHEMPPAKPVALTGDKEQTLEDCDSSQIVDVLQNHLFNDPKIVKKLGENKDMVIQYIKVNELNGKAIKEMSRKQFGQNICDYCNNKKLKGPLMKLFKAINEFNYNSIATKPENPEILSLPSTLTECTTNHLIFIIKGDIISKTPQLMQHKDKMIAYFTLNKINGKEFNSMNRKKFGQDMIAELGDKKLNGPALKLYNNLKKYPFPTTVISPSEIALSISTGPFPNLKRNKSSSSVSSIESTASSSYDNLTCHVIGLMAKDHATESLSMTHKKIQRSIDRNHVEGKIFMNKFDVNDSDEFITFFNQKICGGKATSTGNKKLEKFRKWLINEVKEQMDDESDGNMIKQHNIVDFTKFILDGYDEFIANIFVLENINGHEFMAKGQRGIATKICEKYGVPRGGITNLCHAIEDKLKTDHAKYTSRNTSKSKRWISQKSTRFLPKINFNEKLNEEDDVKTLNNLNTNQFIQIVNNVINDINNTNSCNLNIDKLVKEIKTRNINGRIFMFLYKTHQTFSTLLQKAEIMEYHQLIYENIKNYDIDSL